MTIGFVSYRLGWAKMIYLVLDENYIKGLIRLNGQEQKEICKSYSITTELVPFALYHSTESPIFIQVR
jgi:hypothetical protein